MTPTTLLEMKVSSISQSHGGRKRRQRMQDGGGSLALVMVAKDINYTGVPGPVSVYGDALVSAPNVSPSCALELMAAHCDFLPTSWPSMTTDGAQVDNGVPKGSDAVGQIAFRGSYPCLASTRHRSRLTVRALPYPSTALGEASDESSFAFFP
ncbi:hypothetical protein LX36DRAFT_696626 [Colletotrichum falcatum]|nr:hypothetical protein LX36DRAFT_696626 [Colletotrichum falcatum]